MEFGINFFPDVGPEQKSGHQYFKESLNLCETADALGYGHVRIVEHYFQRYGGYSPNPVVFLSAASQRTRTMRLITGAVLPVFNNPLKLAGELAMLDCISNGRLEIGFARAFLPHEFAAFGIPLDESRARFEEGMAAVTALLTQERASFAGQFHRFQDITSLPRPVQQPRPPYWVAAFSTEESFRGAGSNGHHIMAIPLSGAAMAPLIATYREAWRAAGHAGQGRVMLAFHMYCAPSDAEAEAVAEPLVNAYLHSLYTAAADWGHLESRDYPGYATLIEGLRESSYRRQKAQHAVLVGTPETIIENLRAFSAEVGGIEVASLQVNFNVMTEADAERSLRLFAEHVIPAFP
jgi:alkanesulfonate monooxygenase SsuD/methylene tetrahydromethanopterin reductase-like flavin-dependent oxidoreductase (luciferase family)